MKARLWSLLVVAGSGGVAGVGACGNARTAGPPPDAPALTLADGCIFWAKLDETAWPTTGTPVLDACGNDNGAVSGSGAKPASDGARGQVGSFSGSACINVASSDALNATTALTMSAWIKPTTLPGTAGESEGILSKRIDRGDGSEAYGIFVWTGNHVWIDLGPLDRFEGSAVISATTWTHVAAVFDGTQPTDSRVKLYINGVSDPLTANAGGAGDLATLPTTAAPLHLGCTPAPKSSTPPTMQTFQGELSDLRMWNRALTTAEITELAKP